MSLPTNLSDSAQNAESEFKAAFLRLKKNDPTRVPKGTSVSQNNVAREAGRDPSALRKSRYPSLIREIQDFVSRGPLPQHPSPRQSALASRRRSKGLKKRVAEMKSDRDLALSQLTCANARILELENRLRVLENDSPQVVDLDEHRRGNL
ncbi:hypothetical protein R75461_04989 [Paraburkholderia nemoris]|nr:hypothetical protein R75461_04989 [Paraburkholderia nemoris]